MAAWKHPPQKRPQKSTGPILASLCGAITAVTLFALIFT